MNKFSNLKKLFNEIELLESAGLYKAANVLHKKFVKEAQQDPADLPSTDQANQPDDYIYNKSGQKAPILYMLENNQFTPEEEERLTSTGKGTDINGEEWTYVNKTKVQTPQSSNTNRLQISPEVLKYAEDIIKNGDYPMPKQLGILNDKERDFIQKVKKGQVDPVLFNEALMTKNQLFSQGLSDAGKQQNTQNALLNNTNNKAFEGLGNVINSGQAKKTQPILNEKEESAVYKRTVDQIRSILSRKNVPAAQKLAKDYQNYFSNPQRNVAFQNQVNRIFSEFKQKSPFGSSVASQPEMSDAEGQTLTQLVNQNVAKQNTTQPNATKPNVSTSTDTNNQLYQIVSNFYRSRDFTVTSPEQMYADLKADPARKNVVRNHIRTSKNPNTIQLVALFDSKTK